MLFGFFASIVLVASVAAIITFRTYFFGPSWELVSRYFEIAESIEIDPDCHIGVGYSSCIDLNIDASEFFKIYEGKMNTTEIFARNHREITNHQDFIETFLFFFKEGASSERVAMNATIIKEISE